MGGTSASELARVVGAPTGPPHPSAQLPLVTDSGSSAAAGYRLLGYRISKHTDVRSIAVTSPARGEGKTTCAINLALALAERSRGHVLLVEANLQYPKVAAILGFAPPVCFAAQMQRALHEPRFAWQAASVFLPNLHVLAVDASTTRSQMLNAPQFQNAVEQLGALKYEHFVLDCPSVLGTADTNIVADLASGILLVALAKSTRKTALRRCVTALEPANVLGSVLMGG